MRVYDPADRPPCRVHINGTWHPGEIRMTTDDDRVNVRWHDGQQNRLDTLPAAQVQQIDPHDAVLRFETDHPVWKYAGAKETAIRDQLGMSAAVYYQTLNRAIDDPGMLEAWGPTVNRLRRVREERRGAR